MVLTKANSKQLNVQMSYCWTSEYLNVKHFTRVNWQQRLHVSLMSFIAGISTITTSGSFCQFQEQLARRLANICFLVSDILRYFWDTHEISEKEDRGEICDGKLVKEKVTLRSIFNWWLLLVCVLKGQNIRGVVVRPPDVDKHTHRKWISINSTAPPDVDADTLSLLFNSHCSQKAGELNWATSNTPLRFLHHQAFLRGESHFQEFHSQLVIGAGKKNEAFKMQFSSKAPFEFGVRDVNAPEIFLVKEKARNTVLSLPITMATQHWQKCIWNNLSCSD